MSTSGLEEVSKDASWTILSFSAVLSVIRVFGN